MPPVCRGFLGRELNVSKTVPDTFFTSSFSPPFFLDRGIHYDHSAIITHLWLQIDPDGTHTLTWDRSAPAALPIDYVGPRPIDPPGPLPKVAYDKWTWELCTQHGFHEEVTSHRSPHLPHVETREIPDRPPTGTQATVVLDKLSVAGDGFLVRVTNTGDCDISDLNVTWQFQNEAGQPVEGAPCPATEIGGSITLVAEQSFNGILQSGKSCAFLFPIPAFSMLKSRVASSSSEQYSIVVQSGSDYQIAEIPGSELGAFVEQNWPD